MEKKIDVDEVRNRRMSTVTPEELRACADAEVGNALGDGRAYEAAAATIEALQAEKFKAGEEWAKEYAAARNAEAERDALAATLEQVRAWLAYKPTASLHDIVAAAPSVSLAHVKAEVLREAAETLGKLYLFKDGTASIAIDPLALRDRADQIESEARHE